MLNSGLSRGWGAWVAMAVERAEVMRKLRKGLSRMISRKLALGFDRWIAAFAPRDDPMTKALLFVLNREMARGWIAWRTLRVVLKAKRESMHKSLIHLIRRELSLGFGAWLTMAIKCADFKRKLRMSLSIMVHRRLALGLACWRSAWRSALASQDDPMSKALEMIEMIELDAKRALGSLHAAPTMSKALEMLEFLERASLRAAAVAAPWRWHAPPSAPVPVPMQPKPASAAFARHTSWTLSLPAHHFSTRHPAELSQLPRPPGLQQVWHCSSREKLDWALLLAAKAGQLARVRALLWRGARVGVQDGLGQTALHAASFAGHTSIVRALLASPWGFDGEALDAAWGAVRDSLDALDENGYTALTLASLRGHLDVIKLLIEAGADYGALGVEGLHQHTSAPPSPRWRLVSSNTQSRRLSEEVPSRRLSEEVPSRRLSDEVPSRRSSDEAPSWRSPDEEQSRLSSDGFLSRRPSRRPSCEEPKWPRNEGALITSPSPSTPEWLRSAAKQVGVQWARSDGWADDDTELVALATPPRESLWRCLGGALPKSPASQVSLCSEESVHVR
jgi:hypothetical protein